MRSLVAQPVPLSLIFVAAALSSLGCGGDDDPLSPAVAVTNPVTVDVVLPEDWAREQGTGLFRVIGISSLEGNNDTFAENVNVLVELIPSGLTWESYLDASFDGVRRVIGDLTLVEMSDLKVTGFPARRTIIDYTRDNHEIRAMQYAIKVGSEACIITGTATQQTFGRYRPIFEEIVASLSVE